MKPTLPDISVLYKLYLEFGRWIVLSDWFMAFLVVLGHDPGADDTDQERSALAARFLQGLLELATLGFIKLDRKKKDAALRLTFDAYVVDG